MFLNNIYILHIIVFEKHMLLNVVITIFFPFFKICFTADKLIVNSQLVLFSITSRKIKKELCLLGWLPWFTIIFRFYGRTASQKWAERKGNTNSYFYCERERWNWAWKPRIFRFLRKITYTFHWIIKFAPNKNTSISVIDFIFIFMIFI